MNADVLMKLLGINCFHWIGCQVVEKKNPHFFLSHPEKKSPRVGTSADC